MSSNRPKPKFRRRGAAIACSVLAFVSIAARGQDRIGDEAKEKSRFFAERAFTSNCTDSSLNPPAKVYYFGPVPNRAACSTRELHVKDCASVMEFTDVQVPLLDSSKLSQADQQNGIEWDGIAVMKYSTFRIRLRVDGVWLPWEKWEDYSFSLGGGVRLSGSKDSLIALQHFHKETNSAWDVQDLFPSSLGFPHMTIEQIEEAKPSSCDFFSNPASSTAPSPAPGHSLGDTYARTVEIVKQNASKGIPDALAPYVQGHPGPQLFRAVPVCYSITHKAGDPPHVNRKCEETGEVVRVPGDLAVPPDFWQSYDRQCRENMQGPGLEVKLKDAGHDDGRKRFMSCTEVFGLGVLRKELIELGVGK